MILVKTNYLTKYYLWCKPKYYSAKIMGLLLLKLYKSIYLLYNSTYSKLFGGSTSTFFECVAKVGGIVKKQII